MVAAFVGDVQLVPRWKQDYEKMLRDFVALKK